MVTVLFDLDDVLYHYDFAFRLKKLAAMSGLAEADILERWIESGWEDQADAGKYATGAEYLAAFNNLLHSSMSLADWLAARSGAMSPNEPVLNLAKTLSAKHQVAVLTNNGPLLAENIETIAPRLRPIFGEAIYTSSGLGAAKPSREVFERIAARLNANLAETYFIDDTAAYIAGAAGCGITAIHYRPGMDLNQAFAALL